MNSIADLGCGASATAKASPPQVGMFCDVARSLLSPPSDSSDPSVDSPGLLNLRSARRSGPLALVVTGFDRNEGLWMSAHAAATLLRRSGARVLYYSADGTFDGPPVSLLDGLALFSAADIVVGAHGSAQSNVLVMRPGSTVIDLIAQVQILCL